MCGWAMVLTTSRLSELMIVGCCGQMMQYEVIQPRQADIDAADAHPHVAESRLDRQALQLLFGRDFARGHETGGCFVADQASECFADGAVVEPCAVPDAERNPTVTDEHPTHFSQRQRLVGKELQPLLAEHHVETGIW